MKFFVFGTLCLLMILTDIVCGVHSQYKFNSYHAHFVTHISSNLCEAKRAVEAEAQEVENRSLNPIAMIQNWHKDYLALQPPCIINGVITY